MKVRIKFSKQGTMKFIGHLDVMRYFQKCMRRADIPIRYSDGFSPHQIMSFAAPLGVGLTSNGEYVDIELVDADSETGKVEVAYKAMSSEEMVAALNASMAEGFEVLSCRKLPDNAGNAMSLVAAADYTVTFRDGYEPESVKDWMEGMVRFYEQDSVLITKKTKRGEKEMDLKPLVYEIRTDGTSLFLRISTGSTDNIKPDLVLDAYYASLGEERSQYAFQIQREEVYAQNPAALSEEGQTAPSGQPRFVSLESLGEEI